MNGPIFKFIDAVSASQIETAIVWASVIIIVLLFAFPLHELFHALVADKLGDRTPRDAGRITLNPFKQLNLLGSTLFLVFGFGWASVPVNYANLGKNWRNKAAAIALAGPAANLLLALGFALLYRILDGWAWDWISVDSINALDVTLRVLSIGTSINTLLMIFNLLPIPSLDGARAFSVFLPEAIEPYLANASWLGILIIFTLSRTGLFTVLVTRPANTLADLLLGFAP